MEIEFEWKQKREWKEFKKYCLFPLSFIGESGNKQYFLDSFIPVFVSNEMLFPFWLGFRFTYILSSFLLGEERDKDHKEDRKPKETKKKERMEIEMETEYLEMETK